MGYKSSTVKMRPDFMIIGAMKCATSTLNDQLNMQADFFMTTPKEPLFFSDDDIFAKGIQWYESLFEKALPSQLKGESSTHYTKLPDYPNTVSRIKSFYPDIKLIYLMRHPVDRLVSHYIHEWTQRVILSDIDEAVYSFPQLIDYGCYNMQIEPYLDTFGSKSILPVFVERLHNDSLSELQTIFNFLNVKNEPKWYESIKSNVSSERLRTSAFRDVIANNPIIRILRRKFVSKKIRTKIKKLWTMGERPKLSQETLNYAQELFDRDLEILGEKLGLELNCSNFTDKVTSKTMVSWRI